MSEIANPSWASVAINAHAFSVWEVVIAQQWGSNKLALFYYYTRKGVGRKILYLRRCGAGCKVPHTYWQEKVCSTRRVLGLSAREMLPGIYKNPENSKLAENHDCAFSSLIFWIEVASDTFCWRVHYVRYNIINVCYFPSQSSSNRGADLHIVMPRARDRDPALRHRRDLAGPLPT